MDIIGQLQALGLDGFLGGVIVGILIGWNVLPQPEVVKPYTAWLQEKLGALISLFNKKPPEVPPPSANTSK